MLHLKLKSILFSLLGLGIFFWWFAFSFPIKTKTIQFTINPSSTLAIEGSSSVNSFYCGCEEEFQQYCCSLKEGENNTTIYFENTVLAVNTESFDCGGKMINRDMQSALKAKKFPMISLALQEVLLEQPSLFQQACNDWIDLRAQVVLTIAGIDRTVYLNIKAKELQDKQYQFLGTHDLLMSDFGIDPPSPMLGLIKVNDKITISMDFIIEVIENI